MTDENEKEALNPLNDSPTEPNPPPATEKPITITHEVDAPRAAVWRAFTDPDRLDQWWGPRDCPTRVRNLELKPGGIFQYEMTFPDGQPHFGKWVYREIAAPNRIVADVSFCDANGKPIPHPFMPNWPLTLHVESTFIPHGNKTEIKTDVTVPGADIEQRRSFDENRDNMKEDLDESYDRLDAYLAKNGD